MTSVSLNSVPVKQNRLLKAFFQSNPLLAFSTLLYLVLFVVCLVLYVVDARVVLGAPVWLKPLKFAVSFAIYSATLLYLLSFIPKHGWRLWLVRFVSWFYALTALIEVGAITMQAARGVPSHFNEATVFDQVVYGLMGSMAVGIWFASFIIGVLLFFQPIKPRSLAWGIRLGVVVSLIGMLLAFTMTQTPSEAQRALMAADMDLDSFGAHAVGVEDGGAGLALVGWSTEGGDLRVSHFVGIHAMQFLPLLALLLMRLFPKLSVNRQTALVLIASFAYAGLMFLTYWQAMRGQSIVAPDGLTAIVFLGLGLTTVLAAFIALRYRVNA